MDLSTLLIFLRFSYLFQSAYFFFKMDFTHVMLLYYTKVMLWFWKGLNYIYKFIVASPVSESFSNFKITHVKEI